MSRAETIRRYLAERYPVTRFAVLAMILTIAGTAMAGDWRDASVGSVMRAFAAAYLAVLAFRIHDDLEDRGVDRERHPERISVRGDASALSALRLVAVKLTIVAIAIGPQPLARLAALGLLAAVMLVWYGLRPTTDADVSNAHVLMLKYPAIAAIAAPTMWEPRELVRALPLFIALYLLLCAHEWLDDPRLRRRLSSITRGSLP